MKKIIPFSLILVLMVLTAKTAGAQQAQIPKNPRSAFEGIWQNKQNITPIW